MATFSVESTAASAAGAPTTGSSDDKSSADALVAVLGIGVVLGAAAIMTVCIHDPGYGQRAGARPLEGLSLFALFFVVALALERFLEPVAALIPGSRKQENALGEKRTAARLAVAAAAADATTHEAAQHALDAAASAQAGRDRRRADRAVALWAMATVLAMWAAATLRLYFLGVVGIEHAPRGLEILATGLIVGAGTKPLHDLVAAIEAMKETSQTAASSG